METPDQEDSADENESTVMVQTKIAQRKFSFWSYQERGSGSWNRRGCRFGKPSGYWN